MYSFTANEAKTQFGDVLNKAQREPVHITKNGRPSVVVISAEDFENMKAQLREHFNADESVTPAVDEAKLRKIRQALIEGEESIKQGGLADGPEFMKALRQRSRARREMMEAGEIARS